MTQFGDIQTRTPPASVVVPPSAFAPDWDGCPGGEVSIGLRPVAVIDLERARTEAATVATQAHPKANEGGVYFDLWAEQYHDALVRWIVARGTCDAGDASLDWEGWAGTPEDTTRFALTAEGARFIFDAWERMRIGGDISVPTATDEDISELVTLLGRVPELGRARGLRVRRLLAFCLEELRPVTLG